MPLIQAEKAPKSLARLSSYLFLVQIAAYALPLVTIPLLTRALGSDGYGRLIAERLPSSNYVARRRRSDELADCGNRNRHLHDSDGEQIKHPKIGSKMKISIIICCFNSADRITQTLKHCAYMAQSCLPADQWEIIVVDNNSSDNTQMLARLALNEPDCSALRIVKEGRQGLAYARRTGVLASRGEFICFIDDDNLPSEDYFPEIIRIFENEPNIGLIGVSTRLPTGSRFPDDVQVHATSYAVGRQYDQSGRLDHGSPVWGAGMACRAAVIIRLYCFGFVPILSGRAGKSQLAGDDTELCLAINLAGYDGWYQDSAQIVHAIDPRRMNPVTLRKMISGFCASRPIISRYAKIANGMTLARTIGFVPLYYLSTAIQITKLTCISLRERAEKSSDMDLLWPRVRGLFIGCLLLAKKYRMQSVNVKRIDIVKATFKE
ncbi:glycosyltransferase [Cupriavidus sp. 2MCAB6]|uniref:glycosyltransferase n=1 Tax=Cupriavidus sp. 2MCAB6 TaxID=3232981 RepID=UPI003F93083A